MLYIAMFLLRRSFWGPGPQKVHHDVSDMDVLFESLDFQGYLFYIHPRDVQASKVWCRTRRPRRRQRRRALGHSRNTAHKLHRATRTGRTWKMQHLWYPDNPHHLGKTWGLLYIYIINIHNRSSSSSTTAIRDFPFSPTPRCYQKKHYPWPARRLASSCKG